MSSRRLSKYGESPYSDTGQAGSQAPTCRTMMATLYCSIRATRASRAWSNGAVRLEQYRGEGGGALISHSMNRCKALVIATNQRFPQPLLKHCLTCARR